MSALRPPRSTCARLALLWAFTLALAPLSERAAAGDDEGGSGADGGKPKIHNPYFEETKWRVWRDTPELLENVPSMVHEGKEKKIVVVSLQPEAQATRIYPQDPPTKPGKPFVVYEARPKPSPRYAGIWDDVYASWSGLHGYVRTSWRGPDGSKVAIRDHIIHFVDVGKRNTIRAGVNFLHQSTTGMAHSITNGYSVPMTTNYEKLYFADCLVTSPAHSSFTDLRDDRSSDLYIAHVSTLFNSVGSSNSETMAITKMIIVGGYLPPATKLLLKRNGLYPACMLYIWKASLPYDVSYGHELRHRVAYKSVGNRSTYPEKYSAAGINKGDKALPFHQYDDLAHMRNMIAMARSMDVAPPEAIFSVITTKGGTLRYGLRKAAVVIQEPDQDVDVTVATSACYDLQGLPVTTRWKLLYGNKQTTIEPDAEDSTTVHIHVPSDDALPEGRTAIALIANNGRFDSNPAILTIYRKKSDLPPNGAGYGDYKFPGTFTNLRPILLDAQDQSVRPGKELSLSLRAIDPEGFPVAFYKRAGEVGVIDGDRLTWRCPRHEPSGARTVTIITSDGTSGDSYGGKQITVYVGKPALMAHISADHLTGPAPLKVRFSAKASVGRTSKTKFSWEVRPAGVLPPKKPKKPKKKGKKPRKKGKKGTAPSGRGRDWAHTFDKPGLYTVELTMAGSESDTETVSVLVTDAKHKRKDGSVAIEGGGVWIRSGDDSPCAFDDTAFGAVPIGESREHVFALTNAHSKALRIEGKTSVALSGETAKSFRVVARPRRTLEAGGRVTFRIRFKPREAGPQMARVEIHVGTRTLTFSVGGEGLIPK